MSNELATLSELELLALIKKAESELERRKLESKDKLKEEIQEQLRNAGFELGDLFPDSIGKRRTAKSDGERKEVKHKYRDPVSLATWSGRGAHPPYWVKRIMEERGWSLEDFKKSGEYDV